MVAQHCAGAEEEARQAQFRSAKMNSVEAETHRESFHGGIPCKGASPSSREESTNPHGGAGGESVGEMFLIRGDGRTAWRDRATSAGKKSGQAEPSSAMERPAWVL